ncbi:MAG: radical SAM family heme chaperone HemW [Acidobacteriota bacterium]|nr:radical SAM family heme chaperone HemW [Acidobacteriota bacterium]
MPGLYISYPFCAQKCTYCNFASGVFPRELERSYVDALAIELKGWSGVPDTVYLGGGTPSQLDAHDLERVLATIPGRPWAEATMEAAPGSITGEKARAWREAGINRVSLGVQSFDPKELARTGRKHNAEVVTRDVDVLREAGIENLNLDLIAGLAGQTAESWRASLDWIERIAPPHVSVYMLEVDEDSRLGREVLLNGKRYGASDVPSDERIVEFYETALARLEALGIRRYEISNFATPGWESRHNLKYWNLEPYFGFGADAHSFDGVMRWQNVESAGEYVELMRAGGSARMDSVAADAMEERFFVGLRLAAGIRPRAEEWARFETPIRRFLDAGLLERAGDSLRLSDRGVLFSNEVFEEFIGA